MKKLLVFIFFIVSMCGINYFQPQFLHEILGDEVKEIYIYSNSKTTINGAETIQNGNGQIVKVLPENLNLVMPQIDSLGGESVVVLNSVSLGDITNKLKLKVVEVSKINNGVLLTGYSPKLSTVLYSNSQKINVQVFVSSNYTIVGYPLIMQGF